MCIRDSPNIMKLYEIYESNHSIYLVTELLRGGALSAIQTTHRNHMSPKTVQKLIKNVIEALVHLESKGLVHRDIKAENLLFRLESTIDSEIVLADFGIATFENAETQYYTRCGTPGYVAPELFKSDHGVFSPKCDIYAAGCVLYSLLFGMNPFAAETVEKIIRRNAKGKIDIPQFMLHRVSPEPLDLMLKMLDANPETRPSASELLNHVYFDAPIEDNDGRMDDIGHEYVNGSVHDIANYQASRFNIKSLKSKLTASSSSALTKLNEDLSFCSFKSQLSIAESPQLRRMDLPFPSKSKDSLTNESPKLSNSSLNGSASRRASRFSNAKSNRDSSFAANSPSTDSNVKTPSLSLIHI
eukprot:TRINITY_DN3064_c0_g1_i2.p1 TRINITY_DN3064_c0_g1~~TRINITY_DN3064_c0_g1_i2.p1  ORF type:complete len:393 (-),score=70.56 TRINITY_DN3064_c0_g1_i2:62-1132(-)